VVIYRYFQYDSWFYEKDNTTYRGGVVTWDAMSSVFPHGMQYVGSLQPLIFSQSENLT